MVVILVIITVALCFIIDWFTKTQPATPKPSIWLRSDTEYQQALSPAFFVEGYRLREGFYFHPGHTWVFCEGPNRARIGIDDFACQLSHPIKQINLLAPDQTLTQGAHAIRLQGHGQMLTLSSPLSGRIIAINSTLWQTPENLNRDPFANWLIIIQTDTLKIQLNNLLSGELIHIWMAHAATRLRIRKHLGLPLDSAFCQGFFCGVAPCSQP